MRTFEEQLKAIEEHFGNITEEELNKNLEECGIQHLEYSYTNMVNVEEYSLLEMNRFIESKMSNKEEQEWIMGKNMQIYAA